MRQQHVFSSRWKTTEADDPIAAARAIDVREAREKRRLFLVHSPTPVRIRSMIPAP